MLYDIKQILSVGIVARHTTYMSRDNIVVVEPSVVVLGTDRFQLFLISSSWFEDFDRINVVCFYMTKQ